MNRSLDFRFGSSSVASMTRDRNVNAAINVRNEGLRLWVSQGQAHLAWKTHASAQCKTQARATQAYPLRGGC